MPITMPAGVLPVKTLSTGDILYGDRTTSYRWEVLTHSGGIDSLAGYLDGVVEPSASIGGELYAAVKYGGQVNVTDLAAVEVQPGFMRIAQLALESVRLRPVRVIDGLPEIPLGVFLIGASPEEWSGSGRVYQLELLDRADVLAQDLVDSSYTVDTATPIMTAVATIIASAGESFTADASVTATLAAPIVWPAATSKLQIVNDLLSAANYNGITVDGLGAFQATPYVVPAKRGIIYEVLNIQRELVDGDKAIYEEKWSRDRNFRNVPNKVIATQAGTGSAPALSDVWTNTDPGSPFSYSRRGNRWIAKPLDNVECPAGTDAEIKAFLRSKAQQSLIAASAVQAMVTVRHLPIPIRVGDVLWFANTPAGIAKRHVVISTDLDAYPLGLMTTKLQEVIDL